MFEPVSVTSVWHTLICIRSRSATGLSRYQNPTISPQFNVAYQPARIATNNIPSTSHISYTAQQTAAETSNSIPKTQRRQLTSSPNCNQIVCNTTNIAYIFVKTYADISIWRICNWRIALPCLWRPSVLTLCTPTSPTWRRLRRQVSNNQRHTRTRALRTFRICLLFGVIFNFANPMPAEEDVAGMYCLIWMRCQ